jgi:murein DD-endopeptidase MepM/ murein hydrolase activator NlpD
VYTCDWQLDKSHVPNGGIGPVTVSFDVYDNAGNSRLAPDGIRQEGTGWSAPMRDWTLIGFQPGVVDHVRGDYWAVDFTSSNTAVYPVRPGVVRWADYDCSKAAGNNSPYCYGNVVLLEHEGGLYSIYTHLQDGSFPKCGPKVGTADCGKTVGIDTQIGLMGRSGVPADDTHLHFAVRKGPPGLKNKTALFGTNIPVRTPLLP